MSFELLWLLSFAAPFGLALFMPGGRSLAAYVSLAALGLGVALWRFMGGITESTDGPATVLILLLFWTAIGGLVAGAAGRLCVLVVKARPRFRRIGQVHSHPRVTPDS